MTLKRQPVPVALGFCLLNWLVPGGGYLAARDFRRGLALFILLNGCFLLGLAYEGVLIVPTFQIKNEAFNIVQILTFLVQICDLGGALALIALRDSNGFLADLLIRNAGGAYSDLGAFHFLVAGGLNYFATVRLYDLLAGDAESESSGAEVRQGQSIDAGAPKEAST